MLKPPARPRPRIRLRVHPPPVGGGRRISEVLRALGRCVPALAVPVTSLQAQPLDHRAGFLVSLLDGATDLETLLDICGMPVVEALSLLDALARRGLVRWERA